jgi:putative DNA primase/helicase
MYVYNENGTYKPIVSPKNTGKLEQMIINHKTGKSLSVSKRKNIIHNISTLAYTDTDKLNPEGYICFTNGIYNIKGKDVVPHDPKHYFTVQVPYEYDPDAKSEEWEKFLSEALENNLNKIKLLQEFCGYCFLKTCKYEKALFLEGVGGSGKSTFTETIMRVFGLENCSSTSLSHLTDPVLRCSIRGKMANFDSDIPEKAREYEDIFKKISSGEVVKFNEKFLPSIDEKVHCKMIFNVNEFPYIKDTTNAFYRRMILIKFNKNFYEEGADVNLKERLSNKENLSGIFNWCMVGLDRLIKNNKFSTNIDMDNQIHELKLLNNPILQFIDEELVFENDRCVSKKELWEHYKTWSTDNGHRHNFSHRKFNKFLFEELKNL